MASKGVNPFILGVLQGMGAPVNPTNIAFLSAWFNREGTRAQYNPLATTQGAPGATQFNSVGVKNYPSLAVGIAATIQTLENGRYGDIVAALKSGTASVDATYKGLHTWSGGGYSSLSGIGTTYSGNQGTSVGGGSPGGGAPGTPQIGVLPDTPAPANSGAPMSLAVDAENTAGTSIGQDVLPTDGNVAALLYLNHLAAQQAQPQTTQVGGQ